MNRINWKQMIVGTLAGLTVMTAPVVGQATTAMKDPQVRMDHRGLDVLHSGAESRQRDQQRGDSEWRERTDNLVVAQGTDGRQEDRRADRQMDRREDRREDRQLDRREDRQADQREDHRSNAGGELRGPDRVESVAGDRGRDGREHARMMPVDRPNRPERVERVERPERPDRPEKAERPERPERPERGDRN